MFLKHEDNCRNSDPINRLMNVLLISMHFPSSTFSPFFFDVSLLPSSLKLGMHKQLQQHT